jgi:ornithine decarboxylase
MIPRDVKSPTAPIPFHKLLKVVAVVDRNDEQTKQLLDHIEADNFHIEISDSYERDVSEDADAGAYIALVDGDRLERARKLADTPRIRTRLSPSREFWLPLCLKGPDAL